MKYLFFLSTSIFAGGFAYVVSSQPHVGSFAGLGAGMLLMSLDAIMNPRTEARRVPPVVGGVEEEI